MRSLVIPLESRRLLSGYPTSTYGLFASGPGGARIPQSQESIVVADWLHNGRIGMAASTGRSVTVGTRVPGGFSTQVLGFREHIDHVATADLNGDGRPDLVVSSFEEGAFGVLVNEGGSTSPSFSFEGWYLVEGINSTALGDIDLDGRVDVACAQTGVKGLVTFFGFGDGSFGGPFNTPAPYELNSVAIGDVVGGNARDVVAASFDSDRIVVFRYDGGHSFTRRWTIPSGRGPADLVIADVTGDSELDVVTANFLGNSLGVLDGRALAGEVAIPEPPSYSTGVGSAPTGICAVDFDGDGDLDVAAVMHSTDRLLLFRHTGTRLSTTAIDVELAEGSSPRRCVSGKLNGDNRIDIWIAHNSAGFFSVVWPWNSEP